MKAVITVVGKDMVGILSAVSSVCAKNNINVQDVTQSILQDVFAMIMIVDISKCTIEMKELQEQFHETEEKMGVDIRITRTEVFEAMHRI